MTQDTRPRGGRRESRGRRARRARVATGLVIPAVLVPLALGAAAVAPWLAGWIEAQRALEERTAAARLDAIAAGFTARVAEAASAPPTGSFVIRRRDDGRAGWPFRAAPTLPPKTAEYPDDVSASLVALGRRALRDGAVADAAELFERATRHVDWPAWRVEDGFAMARAVADAGRPQRALEVLAAVETSHRDAWLGPISAPAAAAALAARVATHHGLDAAARAAAGALLDGRVPIDPTTVDALLAGLRDTGVATHVLDFDDRAARLRRAATAAALDWHRPAADRVRPLPDGGAATADAEHIVVLSPGTVAELATEVAAGLELAPLVIAAPDDGQAIARHAWPPLALARAADAPSRRYVTITWLLGAAAGITLLAGQLVVWRTVRRELALSRLESDFVDLVSHELRTPLAALSVKAEMLAHGDVPPSRVHVWQRDVHRAAVRLGELVDRLLDFARLEKGRILLDRRPVPTRRLIARSIRAGRDALHLGGRRLAVDVPRELPGLLADDELLARALHNLIDNAVRHGAGTVTLAARALDGGVEITIGDEGPGLGDADPERLFEPFRRGTDVTAPGTGLGLAIVDRAVRAHFGRVTAGPGRDGRGAAFCVWLPAIAEDAA